MEDYDRKSDEEERAVKETIKSAKLTLNQKNSWETRIMEASHNM
jgi:hypothetical protein